MWSLNEQSSLNSLMQIIFKQNCTDTKKEIDFHDRQYGKDYGICLCTCVVGYVCMCVIWVLCCVCVYDSIYIFLVIIYDRLWWLFSQFFSLAIFRSVVDVSECCNRVLNLNLLFWTRDEHEFYKCVLIIFLFLFVFLFLFTFFSNKLSFFLRILPLMINFTSTN